MNKMQLIETMEKYLENMCAYHAIGSDKLFRYYSGCADAIKGLLEREYRWDEDNASEHVKAMLEIMEENW
jgi:hypothetical protein